MASAVMRPCAPQHPPGQRRLVASGCAGCHAEDASNCDNCCRLLPLLLQLLALVGAWSGLSDLAGARRRHRIALVDALNTTRAPRRCAENGTRRWRSPKVRSADAAHRPGVARVGCRAFRTARRCAAPRRNTAHSASATWRRRSAISPGAGDARFRAGDLDGAEAAADRRRVGIEPEEPQVYFLLGNIAEARGDIDAALDAFDRAATLAEADNAQLAVVSKMRYGMLLQQFQMPGAEQRPLDLQATQPQHAAGNAFSLMSALRLIRHATVGARRPC